MASMCPPQIPPGQRHRGERISVSSDVTPTQAERAAWVLTGVRIEYVTVAWMVVEAVVSIGAGVPAGSLLLVAFGLDSDSLRLAHLDIPQGSSITESEGGVFERSAGGRHTSLLS